jgi:Flp pilus assembly protein TadG
MYQWNSSITPKLRRALHDRRGVAALVFAVAATALIGTAGFALDVGVVLSARQALQANTNAAVLDGAYQWSQTGTQSAALSAAQTWNATHPVRNVSGIAGNASAQCISRTSGLPSCGTVNGVTVNNAVALTQTGTVPTYFVRVLGINSWTVSATATAAKAGGPTKAMNIMFVLDTTKSMGTTTDDTGCKVPGISSPTRLDCARYGVQLILKQLNPQIDQVGLMVFPGMSGTWTPCGSPSIVKYGTASIVYQVIHNALDANYATSIGNLSDSSNLVKTVGDNSNSFTGCLQAPGGEGTFYAQAISAAQTALQSEGSSTAQNVIILLSDGEANATSSDMDSTYASTACSPTSVCSPGHLEQQCNQAVVNAQSATTNGTWVFAIAYDAGGAGTGCPSQSVTSGKTTTTIYDSPNGKNVNVWTPCTALQTIASDQTKFYSTNASCSSVNNYSDVASAFQQVAYTLSQPRLVLY